MPVVVAVAVVCPYGFVHYSCPKGWKLYFVGFFVPAEVGFGMPSAVVVAAAAVGSSALDFLQDSLDSSFSSGNIA